MTPFTEAALSFGKRAELYVLGELLKRGAEVYVPVVDRDAVDLIVRKPDCSFSEVQVKGRRSGKYPLSFMMRSCQPRLNYFIVCVLFEGETPVTWVVPSMTFVKLARRDRTGFDFDLGHGAAGRKRAAEVERFKEGWDLLTHGPEDEVARLSEESFAEDWLSEEDSAYDKVKVQHG